MVRAYSKGYHTFIKNNIGFESNDLSKNNIKNLSIFIPFKKREAQSLRI